MHNVIQVLQIRLLNPYLCKLYCDSS